MVCNKHNPRVDYCPMCKIEELEAKLAASIQSNEYSHDNLMILERNRQKAWDEIADLKKEVEAWRERFPIAGFDGDCIVLGG